MDFIQYVAYLMAFSGAYWLFIAVNTTSRGWLNSFLFRVFPCVIGAACLWFSAIMLVQA